MSIDPRDKVFSDIHKKVFGFGGNEMRDFKLTNKMLIDLYRTGEPIELADDVKVMKICGFDDNDIITIQITDRNQVYCTTLANIKRKDIGDLADNEILYGVSKGLPNAHLGDIKRMFDIDISVEDSYKNTLLISIDKDSLVRVISNIAYVIKGLIDNKYSLDNMKEYAFDILSETDEDDKCIFKASIKVSVNDSNDVNVELSIDGDNTLYSCSQSILIENVECAMYNELLEQINHGLSNLYIRLISENVTNNSIRYKYYIRWGNENTVKLLWQ